MVRRLSSSSYIPFMELGHLLTRSGLTYPVVSSKVYHDSFCQLGSSVSLLWVIYFDAFYLHVVWRLFKIFFGLLYVNETTRNKIKLRKWIKDKIWGTTATNQLKIPLPQFSYLKYKLNLYSLFLWAWNMVCHPKRRTKKGEVLWTNFRAESLKITDRNLVKMWGELNV